MALVSSMVTSANRYAHEPSIMETGKTLITLNNVRIGQKLFIKDSNGSVIYEEFIEVTGSFSKEFDLATLPDGLYFIELNKDVQINVIPFTVHSNGAELHTEKETTIFKPVVRLKDNFVFVAKLSMSSEPMEIELYYDSGASLSGMCELLHHEKIENTTTIHRVYKLDKYEKGNYKVIFKSEGRTFTEKVAF